MAQQPSIIAVNVSPGGIPKLPVSAAKVAESGIVGDAHNHEKHNTPLQAISILDEEDLDDLRAEGFNVYPGATGENITVRHLNVDALRVGDQLKFSGGVVVELTKVRRPCFVLDAIDLQLKRSIAGRCGFLAKVLREGTITPGETIEVLSGTCVQTYGSNQAAPQA